MYMYHKSRQSVACILCLEFHYQIYCVANQQHIEIQAVSFFPFYFTSNFAYISYCHFAPNAPKSHLWVSDDQNLHIFGPKIPQNANKNPTFFWLQISPKLLWGSPMIQNFHFGRAKNAKSEKKPPNLVLLQIPPKINWGLQ